MSWIPVEERLPERRGELVWVTGITGDVFDTRDQSVSPDLHTAWMRKQPLPEPYQKPRRFVVDLYNDATLGITTIYCVRNTGYKGRGDNRVSLNIPTREAAQKIADIYEEAYGDTRS